MRTPSLRQVLLVQGGYYLATGVSPFVSRRLFEAVTGRKREWWLVQTVGGLVTAIGGGLTGGAVRGAGGAEGEGAPPPELLAIAAGSAATLAAIDVVHVTRGRIAPVYLLDAAAEVLLIGALGAALRQARRGGSGPAAARP